MNRMGAADVSGTPEELRGLRGGAPDAVPPRYAEFDGQVVRQWMVEGDSETPDQHHVAVDDGTRDKAWDFTVGTEPYRQLTPGTFVHVRVNLRRRSDLTVQPVEPACSGWPGRGPASW